MVFAEVVRDVQAVVVVVSTVSACYTAHTCYSFSMYLQGSGLQRVGELSYKQICDAGMASLEPSERKAVPFLRVWCLAEIAAAFEGDTPLVLACGKHAVKRLGSSESQVYFETNTALLYNMQFLVSVEHAEATVASDKDMILDRVRDSTFPSLYFCNTWSGARVCRHRRRQSSRARCHNRRHGIQPRACRLPCSRGIAAAARTSRSRADSRRGSTPGGD